MWSFQQDLADTLYLLPYSFDNAPSYSLSGILTLTQCYRLNIMSPTKIHRLKANPQCDDTEKEALGWWGGCKGGAITIWIRALIIETLKNALSPSAHGGCSKKTAICKEGESHQTLEWLAPDLELQANRNKFLLFISSSVYDILL